MSGMSNGPERENPEEVRHFDNPSQHYGLATLLSSSVSSPKTVTSTLLTPIHQQVQLQFEQLGISLFYGVGRGEQLELCAE
uniref:Uncharacterized protein n=1 Tax=Caenorhabditis japonica TaxID=281687 RepID=A0A8R1IS70_CAEJA